MKHAIAWICFLLAVSLHAQEPLTNETIIKLAKAGIGEDIIVATINQQAGKYALSADDMIAMKKAGVPDKVIAAMVVRNGASNAQPIQPVANGFAANALVVPQANPSPLILHDSTPIRLRGQQVVTWTPQMDHAYVNGHMQYRAASNIASVAVVMIDSEEVMSNKRLLIAAISVTNRAGEKCDLFPNKFTLSLVDAKKPPKPLDYYSPEAVIKMLNRALAWNAFWSGVGSGMATRQETTTSNTAGTATATGPAGTAIGTYNGTTTTTRQVPDEQAQARIAEEQRQREQTATGDIAGVNQYSLRPNTLEPGQEVKGVVFFKRDSSCGSRSGCQLKLVLPVGDTTFDFPIQLKKRS